MATLKTRLQAAPDLEDIEKQQINSLIPPEGDEKVGFTAFRILEEIVRDK